MLQMKDMSCAIGIDLGGTSIKFGVLNAQGVFLYEGKLPSYADVSAEAIIAQLLLAARQAEEFARGQGVEVAGVGIGTPGIVDSTGRIVLGGAENLRGWEQLALADRMEDELSLPVRLDNDANLMGLGELCYGAGRGCSDILFLTIGTGIGGAIVIGGEMYSGYANRGAELGHVPLFADGERCACGSIGCVEHYASASALVRQFAALARERDVQLDAPLDGELIVRLYQESHPLAVACMERHFYYLGRAIAGFINVFSPQRVVIGGGLSEAGDFYLEHIRQVAFEHAFRTSAVHTRIMKAALGNKAGTAGAAAMIFRSSLRS